MSERQNEANRRNAQLSTGPRTQEGKARVALNALKHGLTGQQVVLPNENPEDFDTFRTGLLSALDPHGELEETLAERIVIDRWRLRRVPLLESALYRRGHLASIIAKQENEVSRYEYTEMSRLLEKQADETKVDEVNRQAHADARAKLKELRSKMDDTSMDMTVVFEKYLKTFENLTRYENGLSRSLLRNLHELQRLQAIRAGELVAAPVVVDVDVNIGQDGAIESGGNFTKQTHLATRCDAAAEPVLVMAESQGK
jgi:hypothetical protein